MRQLIVPKKNKDLQLWKSKLQRQSKELDQSRKLKQVKNKETDQKKVHQLESRKIRKTIRGRAAPHPQFQLVESIERDLKNQTGQAGPIVKVSKRSGEFRIAIWFLIAQF